MKLLTIIVLLLSLISCGKKRCNKSGDITPLTQEQIFLKCSYAQVNKQCLDYASTSLIRPRFFYYRACFQEYRACLRNGGF
jgi:hypothetical protein